MVAVFANGFNDVWKWVDLREFAKVIDMCTIFQRFYFAKKNNVLSSLFQKLTIEYMLTKTSCLIGSNQDGLVLYVFPHFNVANAM